LSLAAFLPLPAARAGTSAATILVVGDSLSAAYGLRQEEGWVELMRRRIVQEKLHYSVVNASISGETTAGGASRVAGLLDLYRPAIVVVALGGNDGLRGTPLKTVRMQLTAILRECRTRRARALVVGVEIPPNYGIDYARDFSALFTRIARDMGLPVVPSMLAGFGDRRELFQPDGIHPTASAQAMVLENVWRQLAPMLLPDKKRGEISSPSESVNPFTPLSPAG
jgi:acyl-CoA thioesterase-1